jgi:hypothetical protein
MEEQLGGKLCVELYKLLKIVPDTHDFEHPSNLVGVKIQRDFLLESGVYDTLTEIVNEFKGVYSTSGMRCLRSDAHAQKHPVLNLVRQISKANGLVLVPNAVSAGYDARGRKIVKRWFEVRPMDESFIESRCLPEDKNQHENVTNLLEN